MLRTALAFDIQLTEQFVKWVENFMPMRQLKMHYTALEVFTIFKLPIKPFELVSFYKHCCFYLYR